MKDADVSISRASSEETDRFQTLFLAQQHDLEKRLSATSDIPKESVEQHLSGLAGNLNSLQKLYSSSAPYLKIYDRKVCQDSIASLQTKLQEAESRLLPRKKFAFKGSKSKHEPKTLINNGEPKRDTAAVLLTVDTLDGPDNCVYKNLQNQVLILPASAVTGKAVLLSQLSNCTVQITGSPSTLHIATANGSSVACGPVATSVFVESANGCKMQLACQQLRIHQSADTEFRIHVTSKAIIEDSQRLKFGVYSYTYPTIDEDYKLAGLSRDANNWRDIDDFNWLAAGQPSPNWSVISSTAS